MCSCHDKVVLSPKLILLGMLAWLCTSCGTLWFKQGAGPQALQADELACWQAVGSAAAKEQFNDCMQAKGWRQSALQWQASDAQSPAPRQHDGTAMVPASVPSARAAAQVEKSVAAQPTKQGMPAQINGWWKRGATPMALEQDQQHCQTGAERAQNLWENDQGYLECKQTLGWQPF